MCSWRWSISKLGLCFDTENQKRQGSKLYVFLLPLTLNHAIQGSLIRYLSRNIPEHFYPFSKSTLTRPAPEILFTIYTTKCISPHCSSFPCHTLFLAILSMLIRKSLQVVLFKIMTIPYSQSERAVSRSKQRVQFHTTKLLWESTLIQHHLIVPWIYQREQSSAEHFRSWNLSWSWNHSPNAPPHLTVLNPNQKS